MPITMPMVILMAMPGAVPRAMPTASVEFWSFLGDFTRDLVIFETCEEKIGQIHAIFSDILAFLGNYR